MRSTLLLVHGCSACSDLMCLPRFRLPVSLPTNCPCQFYSLFFSPYIWFKTRFQAQPAHVTCLTLFSRVWSIKSHQYSACSAFNMAVAQTTVKLYFSMHYTKASACAAVSPSRLGSYKLLVSNDMPVEHLLVSIHLVQRMTSVLAKTI